MSHSSAEHEKQKQQNEAFMIFNMYEFLPEGEKLSQNDLVNPYFMSMH